MKTSLFFQKNLIICLNVLGLLFFILALPVSFEMMETNELASFEVLVTFWAIGSFICIFFAAYVATKFLSKKQYILTLIGLAFLLRLLWAYFVKTPVASDFYGMYRGALNIVNGDYTFTESFYFQKWTYQLGFTSYEALIISLFGESPRALKLLNILYSVATILLVYLSASKLFNEFSGRIAGLLYAFFIPSILMSSVLTNQHLSIFLYFFALYLVINNGFSKKYRWIAIGLLIGIGNVIRPLGSIILLTIALYSLIIFFLNGNKQNYFMILKKLFGIVVVFYLIQQIISYTIIGFGITDQTMVNKDSLWKFVVGFNQKTRGKYNAQDGLYLDQFSLWDERNEKAKELIKERLSDKGEVLELMKDKFIYMWGDKDSSIHWSLKDIENTDHLADFLYKLEKAIHLAIVAFGLISLASLLFARHEADPRYLIFLIFLVGYVSIHFLIEVQTRYRLDIMPCLFILQGYGVYVVTEYFSKLVKRRVQSSLIKTTYKKGD